MNDSLHVLQSYRIGGKVVGFMNIKKGHVAGVQRRCEQTEQCRLTSDHHNKISVILGI